MKYKFLYINLCYKLHIITNALFKKSFLCYYSLGKDVTQTNQPFFPISEYEQEWRRNTIDYKMRFCGHCNTTTDIKEANFFGR